jgi:regulatory protein
MNERDRPANPGVESGAAAKRAASKELDRSRAWAYALNLLSRRSYTEAEIRERLGRKGAVARVVDETIAKLADYRLIDDATYAQAYVSTNSRRKGSLALRLELRRKGVPEELAVSSLEPLDSATERESASSLLQRNAWRFQTDDGRRNRARAFAFLARRGFPAGVVTAVLEESAWLQPDGDVFGDDQDSRG